MKILAAIAGALLGLMFFAFSLMFFLNMMPPPPPDMPVAAQRFMEAVGPTGFMKFVKAFEMLGAVLVAIPLTRNLGLLILGPIIVNILAFHAFIEGGFAALDTPSKAIISTICLLALFLLWCERKAFAGLVKR